MVLFSLKGNVTLSTWGGKWTTVSK